MSFGTYGTARRYITAHSSAWSWWTGPRAISAGGVVYLGVVNPAGQVVVTEWERSDAIRSVNVISNLSGEFDDHNNPAIILEVGRPPIIVYSRHGQDSVLRYRVGTADYVAGASLGSFNSEQTLAMSGPTTYAIAHVYDGTIFVWTRRWPSGSRGWTIVKSTDWGSTWTTVDIINATVQLYVAARLVGSTIRFAISPHPVNGDVDDQNIYYGEIDAVSGDIKSESVTIGNLDGTGLPLGYDDFEVAYSAGTDERTWIYDVGPGESPEIVFSVHDQTVGYSSAEYHYSGKLPGWTSTKLTGAGGTFEGSTEPYFGGCQFDIDSSVILSRLESSVWYVERWVNDGGWGVDETIATQAVNVDNRGAVRVFPVVPIDGIAKPFDVAINWTRAFAYYYSWGGSVGPVRLN